MENKTQKLIDGIIEVQPTFFDNSFGGYEFACPFCYAYKREKDGSMSDLEHENDCIWLYAMELERKQNKWNAKTELNVKQGELFHKYISGLIANDGKVNIQDAIAECKKII